MQEIKSNVEPIIFKDKKLFVLDQRILPYEKKYLEITSYKEVINAIKEMIVRGAPLIGITAAYGMALAANEFNTQEKLIQIGEEIKLSRPTAVNLRWAVDLILTEIRNQKSEVRREEIINLLIKKAIWIHEDDRERCRKIGEHGLSVIARDLARNDIHVMTICNTGSLATGGIGTAFGVILTAHKKGLPVKVFAAETRPRQQGARLTTFECVENGIDCTLISDTACGYLMKAGEVDLVIAGADRIASNGDTANKIGTYQLAILAKEHNIPFYIAAPLSTFDLKIKSGDEIPIEERDEKEVTQINDRTICAGGVKVKNPAFDATSFKYITGIITEKGVLSGDYRTEIKRVFNEVAVV